MNREFTPNISKNNNALIALRNSQNLQICHSSCTKILDGFDKFKLQIIHIQPQIFKRNQ